MSGGDGYIEAALKGARAELAELEERRGRLQRTIADLEHARDSLNEAPAVPGSPAERRHSGKYRKLFEYLVKHDPEVIALAFSDVEEIVGLPLPPSSRRHLPHWYGYEGSAVARAIRDAGWKAKSVNLERETLELWPEKMLPESTPAW